MNKPKAPPSAKPIPPAMTDLTGQDSIAAWIYSSHHHSVSSVPRYICRRATSQHKGQSKVTQAQTEGRRGSPLTVFTIAAS
ncbi:hypothetical protein ACKS0A_03387 [Histoplasma ohiense]